MCPFCLFCSSLANPFSFSLGLGHLPSPWGNDPTYPNESRRWRLLLLLSFLLVGREIRVLPLGNIRFHPFLSTLRPCLGFHFDSLLPKPQAFLFSTNINKGSGLLRVTLSLVQPSLNVSNLSHLSSKHTLCSQTSVVATEFPSLCSSLLSPYPTEKDSLCTKESPVAVSIPFLVCFSLSLLSLEASKLLLCSKTLSSLGFHESEFFQFSSFPDSSIDFLVFSFLLWAQVSTSPKPLLYSLSLSLSLAALPS